MDAYDDIKRHNVAPGEIAKLQCGSEVRQLDDRITVDLWYPTVKGNIDTIEIELVCVRSADSIRIQYDYERDGYVVLQSDNAEGLVQERGEDGKWHEVSNTPETWSEVAFIPARPQGEEGESGGG